MPLGGWTGLQPVSGADVRSGPTPDSKVPRVLAGTGGMGSRAREYRSVAHHTHISADPEHFAARVLQDCLNESLVSYWLRRAAWFDTCNPLLALNCRRHAWLLAQTADSEPSAEVLDALSWAADQ